MKGEAVKTVRTALNIPLSGTVTDPDTLAWVAKNQAALDSLVQRLREAEEQRETDLEMYHGQVERAEKAEARVERLLAEPHRCDDCPGGRDQTERAEKAEAALFELELNPLSVKLRAAETENERLRKKRGCHSMTDKAIEQATAGQELIEGPRGMFVKPSTEEMVKRLQVVVAWLATEHDMRDESHEPHMGCEEFVERTLYPEHF